MKPVRVLPQVLRGAAMLDAISPNWFEYVNPRLISMTSDRSCILGQLARRDPEIRRVLALHGCELSFRGFNIANTRYGAFPEYSLEEGYTSIECGFYPLLVLPPLKPHWQAAILQRRRAKKISLAANESEAPPPEIGNAPTSAEVVVPSPVRPRRWVRSWMRGTARSGVGRAA